MDWRIALYKGKGYFEQYKADPRHREYGWKTPLTQSEDYGLIMIFTGLSALQLEVRRPLFNSWRRGWKNLGIISEK
jgi:hypothetical protein